MVHIFPGLSHIYIISIGKLYYEGCQPVFDKHTVLIISEGDNIIELEKYRRKWLWNLPIINNKKN